MIAVDYVSTDDDGVMWLVHEDGSKTPLDPDGNPPEGRSAGWADDDWEPTPAERQRMNDDLAANDRVAEAAARYYPGEPWDEGARVEFEAKVFEEVEREAVRRAAREAASSASAANAAAAAASWEPVDIAGVVDGLRDGSLQTETPEVGEVENGSRLFYSGRVSGVAGEAGSGKTWSVLVACAQQLAKREHVVYLDYEDTPRGIVERLLNDLDAKPRAVKERFHYFRPTTAPDASFFAYVEKLKPSLVVIDSTGEAMGLEAVKSNADEEVAAWFVRFPRRLASLGPAVVLIDHLPKDRENQDGPIGSQRKKAAVDGVQYIAELERPFSRSEFGGMVLRAVKDRLGTYARNERVARLAGGGGAEFRLVAPPVVPTNPDGSKRYTAVMEKVSRTVEESDKPLSGNAVFEAVGGKRDIVRGAVKTLVAEGYLSETPHKSLKPYQQADDPLGPTGTLERED